MYPDVRTETTCTCRICGRVIKWERSRLFWTGDGTIRTCSKGVEPHEAPAKRKEVTP